MTTVTIPAELADRQDLVAVPREEYERFVAWQMEFKSKKTFAPTPAEKKALAKARSRRVRGDYLTLDELRRSLGTAR